MKWTNGQYGHTTTSLGHQTFVGPISMVYRSNLDGILDHCRYYRLTTVDILAPYLTKIFIINYSLLIIHFTPDEKRRNGNFYTKMSKFTHFEIAK